MGSESTDRALDAARVTICERDLEIATLHARMAEMRRGARAKGGAEPVHALWPGRCKYQVRLDWIPDILPGEVRIPEVWTVDGHHSASLFEAVDKAMAEEER